MINGKAWLSKRFLQILFTLFVAIAVSFSLIHLAGGDPAAVLCGEFASPEYVELIRNKYGLDKPLIEQFWLYLLSIIKLDFGYSFYYGCPVIDVVLEGLGNSLLILVPSVILMYLIGILLGCLIARKPHGILDNIISLLSLSTYSSPTFWIGLVLMLIFSINLRLLPVQGMMSPRPLEGLAKVLDIARHMVLPVLIVVMWNVAIITRTLRSKLLDTLHQDYIQTALAKGLSKTKVIFRHALPNAISPVIHLFSIDAALYFEGELVTEIVFGWPGIGRILYKSLLSRDYPLIMALLIITTFMVMLFGLIADIVNMYIDPRIRIG